MWIEPKSASEALVYTNVNVCTSNDVDRTSGAKACIASLLNSWFHLVFRHLLYSLTLWFELKSKKTHTCRLSLSSLLIFSFLSTRSNQAFDISRALVFRHKTRSFHLETKTQHQYQKQSDSMQFFVCVFANGIEKSKRRTNDTNAFELQFIHWMEYKWWLVVRILTDVTLQD